MVNDYLFLIFYFFKPGIRKLLCSFKAFLYFSTDCVVVSTILSIVSSSSVNNISLWVKLWNIWVHFGIVSTALIIVNRNHHKFVLMKCVCVWFLMRHTWYLFHLYTHQDKWWKGGENMKQNPWTLMTELT